MAALADSWSFALYCDNLKARAPENPIKQLKPSHFPSHSRSQSRNEDQSSLLYRCAMVDFGYLGDVALNTWVNMSPSTQWANDQVEPYRGLPFGTYLHSAPPRRQRTLTGTIDPTQLSLWHKVQVLSSLEPEQRTDEQETCGFLHKLPYDVRLIIYEMVLGGSVLHLTGHSTRSTFWQNQNIDISHNICKHPDRIADASVHQDCSLSSTSRPSSRRREDSPQATGLLPLLVTCRRVYSEAINTLYSANTFEFNQNNAAFTFLKRMVPSQRLQHIRHFRFRLRIPRHPLCNGRATRDWQDLWKFFDEEMTGLRSLYMQILMLQPMEQRIEETDDNQAEDWIKPMVLMAVSAHYKRGCSVQIETRNKRQEPVHILHDTTRSYPNATSEEILSLTCAELHKNIRTSLG